ncbi:uncharacterized protein M6B38_269925 [Iris pallida]|uniref:AAA+ ATPase domain-containing protein n=2 Tax=Iris pallida TaxID=29817 RepID=A0AAX6I7K2_IRIPA|nr:uncharacterized protein M6B38_269925 [Iris pallida]
MYVRRVKCRSQKLISLYWQSCYICRSSHRVSSQYHSVCSTLHENKQINRSIIRKFCLVPFSLPSGASVGIPSRHRLCPHTLSRFYSSEGDGSNASEGKHIPIKDAKGKNKEEDTITDSKHKNAHVLLGEQEQQEWVNSERLSIDIKRKESPFLTKRERFKNEFLRRVLPWDMITVTWKTFPYYIHENTKSLLVECAASHLKNGRYTTCFGNRLSSSSGRMLLQSLPGTELYRERVVRALAHDLQVPLLMLDSSVLAPHDFGYECATSECETDDENAESGDCTTESEIDNENDASNEDGVESEDEDGVKASAEALKKIEEFANRVSGEVKSTSASAETDTESAQKPKRPLVKGDRVKYVGDAVNIEVDNRIILGKIPTSDGSTNAYTFISGRPLSIGQRGEVYEINGDQVAIILDNIDSKTEEGNKDENKKHARPSIYWFDIQDIVHDVDLQSEGWYIALEALSEVLKSLRPLIVYFPDSSQWFSRAVPKSKSKEFISKVEETFDHLPNNIVWICGQNIMETGTNEKEKHTMVLRQLGRMARLPVQLKQLTEGLRGEKSSKDDDICKLFPNNLFIQLPKEEELLRIFNKQIEDDRRIIISRNNIIELQKVLEENELVCTELLGVKTESVILTKQKAEKVVGWARNHYLSSNSHPSVDDYYLVIPRDSLDIAISRLGEQEAVSRKPAQSLKSLAKDEYESNFLSAVVTPDEIGVKFDDIGALEDVKKTLNELVTLPMRRPELFLRGNLLRPCKGILLFGPPGTGKTLLAKALATEAGANFISITGSVLTSKWFGDAEKLTKALFSFATRLAPVIIFVDEVDSLLGARGGAFEHEATRRMRNEFMAAWDGLRSKDSQRILIVGATNRPFDLDDAVIRRLPRRIYVDLPDVDNRMKILRIFLSQENLEPGFRYDELAKATEGYSGSDLKNLCIAAAYRPVQELLEEEQKQGVTGSTPSLRHLSLEDFLQAKAKVGASVAYDAASMNELRKWNEQYGEGGSRKKSPFGF